MKKSFSVSKPFISKDDIKDIRVVLKTGWITYGPKSIELEEKVKNKIKTSTLIGTFGLMVNQIIRPIIGCQFLVGAHGNGMIKKTNFIFIIF